MYNHQNLHIANLSLDLFLGAVRTEPERQRDFVPIPLDVIDTTGTVVVGKAKCNQSPIINIEVADRKSLRLTSTRAPSDPPSFL
jgi:hypothetical protein